MNSPSLNAAQRAADLEFLAAGNPVDLLVVGGGVTGTGVALDAASRGLSVALVERRDLANGTSRWSSKLIHGGLRYLRQFQLGLVWESAVERHILMSRTAPHLVRPLAFVAPLNHSLSRSSGVLTEIGMRVGDAMGTAAARGAKDLPGPRRISAAEALSLAPSLRRSDLRGALVLWDGQLVDDVRLVVGLARTAAMHGARVLTYCSALQLERGRAQLRDERSGQTFSLSARAIVNATGVWADTFDERVKLRPSKGSHLVIRASALGNPRAAVLTPVQGESARWIGATPVGDGRVIVGLTDDAYDGPIPDEPTVSAEEEQFILGVMAQALERPITSADVVGRFAGFRPLLASGKPSTADLSRRHTLLDGTDGGGVTTIVGGKLTTYRRMAEDVVDQICVQLGHAASCRTSTLPLVGAGDRAEVSALRAPHRLKRRYGMEAPDLMRLADSRPELLEPLAEGVNVLGVELLFGLRHEGALTLDDLLDRRVRLGLVPGERTAAEDAAKHIVESEAA